MAGIFSLGVERISINNPLLQDYSLIEEGARRFGSQSIIGAVDTKAGLLGQKVVYNSIRQKKSILM